MTPREELESKPRCGAPSPGGNLTCTHAPHGREHGHRWVHESAGDHIEPATEPL